MGSSVHLVSFAKVFANEQKCEQVQVPLNKDKTLDFTLFESKIFLNGKAHFVVDWRLEAKKQQQYKEAKLQFSSFDIDSKINYQCKILVVLACSNAFDELTKLHYLRMTVFEFQKELLYHQSKILLDKANQRSQVLLGALGLQSHVLVDIRCLGRENSDFVQGSCQAELRRDMLHKRGNFV